MSMSREEFREQMTRCKGCGQLTDGGCCPPEPLAFMREHEYDRHAGPMEYHVEAVCEQRFYCVPCYREYEPSGAVPVFNKAELRNDYYQETCCECGEEL